ncbi:DM13 domain-containing protein [Marinicella sp. W31]|uniref:DM13 domain-containing protein n=1 Tax=Marinicella sp. W31 TaxID=3023713 RepID=UPI003757D0A0
MKKIMLLISHLVVLALGVVLGIYLLPILTAPPSPPQEQLKILQGDALYSAEFHKDLADSDFLHWGEGTVSISEDTISFMGKLAPGPDYQLYLTPRFVETEDAFMSIKDQSKRLGAVNTFNDFILPYDQSINLNEYNSIVIWCEAFGQFITAAQFR